MKKKWLIALSLSVLFYACSKDNTNERPDTRQVQIPFKVSVAEFIKKVQQLPSASGRMAPSSIFAKDSTLNTAVSDIYFLPLKIMETELVIYIKDPPMRILALFQIHYQVENVQ